MRVNDQHVTYDSIGMFMTKRCLYNHIIILVLFIDLRP